MRAFRTFAAALVAIAVLAAMPARIGAAPADDPKINARAKEWLDRAQAGNFDRAQLSNDANADWTDSKISDYRGGFAPLGSPTAFVLRARYRLDGNAIYVYRATFATMSINEQLSISADGKIANLSFRRVPASADGALPGEDAAITSRAQSEYVAWQSGKIDRDRYTARAASAFTPALVAQVAGELTAYGAPGPPIFRGKTQAPDGTTIYAYRVPCANTDVWMSMGLDAGGKIDGIAFQPE